MNDTSKLHVIFAPSYTPVTEFTRTSSCGMPTATARSSTNDSWKSDDDAAAAVHASCDALAPVPPDENKMVNSPVTPHVLPSPPHTPHESMASRDGQQSPAGVKYGHALLPPLSSSSPVGCTGFQMSNDGVSRNMPLAVNCRRYPRPAPDADSTTSWNDAMPFTTRTSGRPPDDNDNPPTYVRRPVAEFTCTSDADTTVSLLAVMTLPAPSKTATTGGTPNPDPAMADPGAWRNRNATGRVVRYVKVYDREPPPLAPPNVDSGVQRSPGRYISMDKSMAPMTSAVEHDRRVLDTTVHGVVTADPTPDDGTPTHRYVAGPTSVKYEPPNSTATDGPAGPDVRPTTDTLPGVWRHDPE